jgi:hypothetical protein
MCVDYRQIARSHRGVRTARESTRMPPILPTLQTPGGILEASFTPMARTSGEPLTFADGAAPAKLILPEISGVNVRSVKMEVIKRLCNLWHPAERTSSTP